MMDCMLPEYAIWAGMKDRCNNPNCSSYRNYGGRGIRICERWNKRGSFRNFLADMGPRPSPKHSIDRIDNDGNYEPSNCRWATKKEQNSNRRPYKHGPRIPLISRAGVPSRRPGPKPALSVEDEARVVLAYRSGEKVREIADRFNIGYGTVYRCIDRAKAAFVRSQEAMQ